MLKSAYEAGKRAAFEKLALGLKDMLFFEQQFGKQEAGKLFQDLEAQWQGKPGFARRGTLNITPQGVQLQPHAGPLPPVPHPAAPSALLPAPTSAAPPPIPPAALGRPMRATPPPLPRSLR